MQCIVAVSIPGELIGECIGEYVRLCFYGAATSPMRVHCPARLATEGCSVTLQTSNTFRPT